MERLNIRPRKYLGIIIFNQVFLGIVPFVAHVSLFRYIWNSETEIEHSSRMLGTYKMGGDG